MLTDPQHAGGSGLGFETWESSKASANKDYSQKVGQCSPICLRMILG